MALDPQQTIQKIRDFLNIDDHSVLLKKFHENQTKDKTSQIASEDYEYLKNIYKEDDLLLKSLTGISFFS